MLTDALQMSMEETALAYGTAVTASVTAAIGMNRWVQKSRLLSDASRAFAARFVPFVAVVLIRFDVNEVTLFRRRLDRSMCF